MACKVTREVLNELAALAARAHPHECCGMLTGTRDQVSGLIPATNVHPAPTTHFEIDPQTLIEAHRAARSDGPEVLGYYHSHPNGSPQPSAVDRASASGDSRIWAIIAAGEITLWRDTPDGFLPLPYTVTDG